MLKYSEFKEKDMEYLTFILRHGMVTAKQIMLFFEEPNVHRVYRRLRKLAGKKLVKHEQVAHKIGVYFGTHEARNIVQVDATVPQKASVYIMQHELLVNDLILYYYFSSKKKGISFSYVTEREVRFAMIGEGSNQSKLQAYNETRDRIPDAIFFFESSEGHTSTTWIELELNKKDKKRYDEKFKMFDRMLAGHMEHLPYRYDQVMYFTNDTKTRNALEEAKKSVLNPDLIKVRPIPDVVVHDRWEEVTEGGSTE